jgi:ADP-ribosylglycohydrolase
MLAGFEPAPYDHPLCPGRPAGAVTDDTEQAILLGRQVVAGRGTTDAGRLAAALVAWEADMAARGSRDLLGPSTRRALAAVRAGTPPGEAGASGDTNGAAMRIAPVGIAVSVAGADGRIGAEESLGTLVDRVIEASRVTHNTGLALSGAAAVAAAVSAGLAGATVPEATETAIAAARLAAKHGHWVAGADVAARIQWATALVAARPVPAAAELIYLLVGTSLATQESVPAAFAVLSAVPDDPWLACRLAASLGGDCDTIAAMAGAVSGACHGLAAFPADAVGVIHAHGLGLSSLADRLLKIRLLGSPR